MNDLDERLRNEVTALLKNATNILDVADAVADDSCDEWKEKCWGRTRCVVDAYKFEKHELDLEAGGVCSFHYHYDRANLFDVRSGKVKIVWAFGWKIFSRVLEAGDKHTIRSMVPHQFQVLESGKMFEEYWPERGEEIDAEDIYRLTTGTKVDVELLARGIGIVSNTGGQWDGFHG